MARLIQITFLFLFLATLGATAYLNYIVVGQGEAAVLVERTEGIIEPALEAGDHWVWGASIPGKFAIHKISIRRQTMKLIVQKNILDAQYMDLGREFDLHIPLRIQYKVPRDKVVTLFKNLERDFKRIRPYLKQELSPVIGVRYSQLVAQEAELDQVKDKLQIFIQDELKQVLNKKLPAEGIKIETIRIDFDADFQVPVISAEEKLKYKRYDEFLAKKKNEVLKRIGVLARLEAEKLKTEAYVAGLKKIGPVLTQFPELKTYLILDKLSPRVSLILSDIEKFGDGALKIPGAAAVGNPNSDSTDSTTDDTEVQ